MLRLLTLAVPVLALTACQSPGAGSDQPVPLGGIVPAGVAGAATSQPAPPVTKKPTLEVTGKLETVDVTVDSKTGEGRQLLVNYLLSDQWAPMKQVDQGNGKITWTFMRITYDKVEISPAPGRTNPSRP